MNVRMLRSTPFAVVGLDTTTAVPPQLVGVAVYHLAGPVITGGPFGFWAQPDAPLDHVPHQLWPYVWTAPPWPEVAEHVLGALADRVLVLAGPDRLRLLQQHLPEWVPAAVLFGRDLVGRARPGMDLEDFGTGLGAGMESHTLAERVAAALLDPPPRVDRLPGGPDSREGPGRGSWP